jgi:hypothetical protein
MKVRCIYNALVLSLLGLTGCLPATVTDVPRVSGRVIDTTGTPLPGATIVVCDATRGSGHRSWQLAADRDGRFNHAEQVHWFLAPLLPADLFPPELVAVASYGGAHSEPKAFVGGIANWHFVGITNPSEPAEFGDLVVERESMRN